MSQYIEHVSYPLVSGPKAHAYHLSAAQYEDFLRRYPTEVTAIEVANKVEASIHGNLSRRKAHEDACRAFLGLAALTPTYLVNVANETTTKKSIAQYLGEFTHAAENVYTDPAQKPRKQIAIELGGIIQAGNWNAARPFINLVRGVPKSVMRAFPSARVYEWGPETTPEDKLDKLQRYHYSPEYNDTEDETATIKHSYAQIIRRRALADLYFEGDSIDTTLKTELYLESAFLVATAFLRPEEQKVFAALDEQHEDSPYDFRPIHKMCDVVVRRGLTATAGSTRDIVPVTIHAVAKVRNPLYQ